MLDTSHSESGVLNDFMHLIEQRNPAETEFHQAVLEFARDVLPFVAENPKYRGANLSLRLDRPHKEKDA